MKKIVIRIVILLFPLCSFSQEYREFGDAPEGVIALHGGDLDRSGGGGLGRVLVARRSAAGAQAPPAEARDEPAKGAIGAELAAALAEIRSGGR